MALSKVPSDASLTPETRSFLDKLSRDLGAITPEQIGAAVVTQVFESDGFSRFPAATDYTLVESARFARTITGLTGKLSAGSLTATLKINGVAITDGALSATTTQGSVAPSAGNVMAIGDRLTMTLSSLSSAANFAWTIEYQRTLA